MLQRFGVLVVLMGLIGCGDGPGGEDGGLDARVVMDDAGMDSGGPALCARDLDCDNGDFCDGPERCMPGGAGTDARGCLAGEAPCAAGETCSEDDDTCTDDSCVDEDGDGFTTCGGDCDDTRADINPSTEEVCVPDDPTDEDCNPRTYGFVDIDGDGAADMRCFNIDPSGIRFGGEDCNDNNASISPLAAEVCDGTFDENCDGSIDEDCPCTPEGSVEDCGPGMGACTDAFRTCTAGGWSMCSVVPTAEVCDGSVDENCDGVVDEGCDCINGDSRACQEGICAGTDRCVSGHWTGCLAADGTPTIVPGSMPELCDGIDSDCDGLADADDTSVVGVGDACGSDVGACRMGVQNCLGSVLTCAGEVAPRPEDCSPLGDLDCDGTPMNPAGGCMCADGSSESCDTGICTGTRTCAGGMWGACTGGMSPRTETCNLLDDDCDGSIDDVAGLGATCGTNTGICHTGTYRCEGGSSGSRVCGGAGYVPPATETCNHLDDDCDGRRDDGVIAAGCTRDYPPGSGFSPLYTCYDTGSGSSACTGELTPSPGQARASYASWVGDSAAQGRFSATLSARTSSGTAAFGNMGIIITPQRGVGTTSGWTPTSGLPSLSAGIPALALVYSVFSPGSPSIYEHRGTTWHELPYTIIMDTCTGRGARVNRTRADYLFEFQRMSRPFFRMDRVGTCLVTGELDLPNWFTDFYTESASYPRFYVGTFAYSQNGDLLATMTNLQVQRVASVDGGCDGC